MKKIVCMTLAIVALSGAGISFADKFSLSVDGKPIVHIEVDKGHDFDKTEYSSNKHSRSYDYEAHHLANQRLRQRVQLLEEAVVQLQSAVFALESAQNAAASEQFFCLLKTTSRGSFQGKGATKLEAEGIAREQCQTEHDKFWCKGSISCDSNARP